MASSVSIVMGGSITTSSSVQDEIINCEDSLSQLPEEVIVRLFGLLGLIGLTKCSEISKRWKRMSSEPSLWNAFDLRTLFPSLRVFDESDWVTRVDLSSLELSIADAPPSDKRKEIPALKRLLSSVPIEGNAGVTLLTIPKGLTFNKLIKLAGSPKRGNATQFRCRDRITADFGDIAVDKTYRIVITNNVLLGSRNLSVTAQKDLVHKFGCEMPKPLEAATLLVVTYMSSQQRLYNDYPSWTYTRCSGEVQLVVGGFAPAGFLVFSNDFDHASGYGGGGVLLLNKVKAEEGKSP